MSSEVQRYITGIMMPVEMANPGPASISARQTVVVTYDDYAALEAECEVHRNTAAGAHQQLTENRLETERLAKDWMSAVAERDALRAELAITRRVLDRIGQLCTTPHESKERFIRRVQSVIERERAAQQDQPK